MRVEFQAHDLERGINYGFRESLFIRSGLSSL